QNVGPACRETCGSRHGPDPPFYRRNPRTAVGITRGCRDADPASICRYLLVTVDGRQPDWSRGVRFPALGALLVELGAWDALNLDGGGSTTM
ncbi:MAG TPA: phosphodiester glycosidase family protein, partial [Actinomycetota bacterium]|nr:phosphodiester glycosidase family protein [Actinomycetota bacterium]